MKILVAGGAGYIGSVLVPKLMQNHTVDVVDLCWFGNHLPATVRVFQKDIFDITAKELEAYDQVIFLAGMSNDPMAEFSPSKNFIYNAAAPAYLAYVSKQAKVRRYIYASSCSVYGITTELCDETGITASTTPYGISKLMGEQAVMQLQDENFSVIALRKGTISGPSPRLRCDLIINTMFKCAMQTGVVTVANPVIWRPILGIYDAVHAYTRAVEISSEVSGIFNIASQNITVGEVALDVAGTLSAWGKPVDLIFNSTRDARDYKVNFSKAQEVLGFCPVQTSKSITELLIQFYGFGAVNWDDPNLYNIRVFEKIEKNLLDFSPKPMVR